MNKTQEALNKIASIIAYNSTDKTLGSSYKKQFDLLEKLVNKSIPTKVIDEEYDACDSIRRGKCPHCGKNVIQGDSVYFHDEIGCGGALQWSKYVCGSPRTYYSNDIIFFVTTETFDVEGMVFNNKEDAVNFCKEHPKISWQYMTGDYIYRDENGNLKFDSYSHYLDNVDVLGR